MGKGSPGAILAIGAGVFLLALGWSGRYAAVWEAIRTGEVSMPGGSGTGGPSPGQVANENMEKQYTKPVKVLRTDGTPGLFVIEQSDMRGKNGSTCPTGYVEVKPNAPYTGLTYDSYCVEPSKLAPWLDMGNSGGEVVNDRNYAATIMPNGTFAFRYQPNVEDW
jgi:hypothetical protein